LGNKSAKGNSLSIYLEAMQTANMSVGWSRDVSIRLHVFNQFDTNMTISKGDFLFLAEQHAIYNYTVFYALDFKV